MTNKIMVFGVDYFFVVQNKKTAKVLHEKLNKLLPGSVKFSMNYDDGYVTYTIKYDGVEMIAEEMAEGMVKSRMNGTALCEELSRDGLKAGYDGMEYYVSAKTDDFMEAMSKTLGEPATTFRA